MQRETVRKRAKRQNETGSEIGMAFSGIFPDVGRNGEAPGSGGDRRLHQRGVASGNVRSARSTVSKARRTDMWNRFQTG